MATSAVAYVEAARERREEAERGLERRREDHVRIDGRRGRWEEAERAEGDVERVAVGVEAGEREGRVLRRGRWRRQAHGVQNSQSQLLWFHGRSVLEPPFELESDCVSAATD